MSEAAARASYGFICFVGLGKLSQRGARLRERLRSTCTALLQARYACHVLGGFDSLHRVLM